MQLVRAIAGIAICFALLAATSAQGVLAQIDRDTRDRVVPAAVEVAAAALWEDENFSFTFPVPMGSGTIVTPDGLILTNHHVVADEELSSVIASWSEEADKEFPGAKISLLPDQFLILTSDGVNDPVESYIAVVVVSDPSLDLAVLRITADASGDADAIAGKVFPYVPPGDSSTMGLGDRVHVFSYPSIGGDTLTYTPGVVSGFQREEGITGVAWITTDAVMSGGSSGGTAINDAGELVGVPTQGSELDCRPGDTNRDGVVDVNDIGCIPTGGSLGQLRPINQALPLLNQAIERTREGESNEVAAVTPKPDTTEVEEGPAAKPDLARLALSPADVAREGLDEFVVSWSQMIDQRGVPSLLGLDDTWSNRLAETNLEQVYTLTLLSQEDVAPRTSITSVIWQYPTADDAANGFAFTEENLEGSDQFSDLPAETFGDESELSTWSFSDSSTGEDMVAFEATTRVGSLVGTLRVNGPASDERALQAIAVDLGRALADRLAEPKEGDNALSMRVVRVTDHGIGGSADFYLMQQGDAVPTSWYSVPDGAAEWTKYWRSIGIVDGYETEVYLPDGTSPSPGRVGVRLFEFDSRSDASTYLATYEDGLDEVVTDLREVRNAPTYGDRSRMFTYQTDWWPDIDPEFRVVTVIQEGTTVAVIEVTATRPVPIGVVRGIAAAQEECLVSVCESLSLDAPAWLLALPAPEQRDASSGRGSSVTQAAADETRPVTTSTPNPTATSIPAPTATPQPTATLMPTATPTPAPTPSPTPEPVSELWGLYEEFDDPDVIDSSDTDVSTWDIEDGVFRLAITEPGNVDGVTLSNMPTQGRDVVLVTDIAATTGWGEILHWMVAEDGVTEWHFAVDPVARQWSLYQASTTNSDLFYWVEPRPLPSSVDADVEQVGVQVIDGEPLLYVNGVDVVTPSGVEMPEVPGSVTLGFGAGINPGSVSGAGEYFSVDFEAVTLFELAD